MENLRVFAKNHISRGDLTRITLESRIAFRKFLGEFYSLSLAHQIPFQVVSGGIRELIEDSFEILQLEHPTLLKEKYTKP